ncbi:MAG TPA: tetratricopeptide repeat protein [Acidobacteriaceae bacterium]|nr:tetratricopeptide repeat protein [Acidobacteriaceae bacterium]
MFRQVDFRVFFAGLAVVGAITATGWLRPNTTAHANEDAATARHAYSESIAAKYDYHFGAREPFLPSNATTDTGEFLDPKTFLSASYCGHCHQESHQQWRQSAHANSFRAPWYVKNVNLLMQQKGVEYARHCEGCHNPIALTAGTMTKGTSQKRPWDDDGISCSVCHSIQKVDTRGTGSYVMGQPAVLVDEAGKPIVGKVSDAEILAHLDRHSKAVMQDFYRSPQFCSVCHKAALPKTLNDYKWQRALFVYDEWQMSSFAKQSPLPFYVKDSVSTCQTCHMQREPLTGPDSGAKNGTLVSHRWLGGNTLLPVFYKYDEQMAKTVAFLRTGVFNVDIFAIEKEGTPGTIAPLGSTPFSIAPGDVVTVSVVIQNKGIAHSHVPEQRDMYESWVEFKVKDAAGNMVSHSGFIKPDGNLDERAHSFTNRLINAQGTLNDLHQVWANRVVAYNNTIQSGRSQIVRYQFRVPKSASAGPLSITAQVNYRRFDQHFIDWAMNKHVDMPVIEMASRTRTFNIGENAATPADPTDNKEWMRWNNYGIALLDAQQYGESVHAFEQVAKLRPDYADAFTNIALANFQWEKYSLSRTNLEKALQVSPNNARALYYLALVERNQGNLDAAVADLQQVAALFPASRDAHRELGFSYYQQRKYELARAEYERVQGIDPDDLAAHYNLSIIYRRLGMKEQAAVQSALFADRKDDPTANTYALEYLRKHTEIAAESVAWHTHSDLDAGENAGAAEKH